MCTNDGNPVNLLVYTDTRIIFPFCFSAWIWNQSVFNTLGTTCMFSWDSCGNASPWQPRKWSFEMWQQFNPKQDLIVTLIRQFYWLNITKKFFCLNFPKQWMKTKLRSKSNIKEITRIISSTQDWKVWSLVCNQKLLPLFFFFYTKDFSLTDTNHYWKCLNFSLWTHTKRQFVSRNTHQ